jgi:integrase
MPRHAKVFHWPYCEKYIWQKYSAVLKAAHLPSGRLDKFHRIRKSVASHFEAAGGNATLLLGHTTRSTTVTSYIDPRICAPEQAMDKLFRLAPSDRKDPDKAAG